MSETPQDYTQRILGHVEGKQPLAVQATTAKKLNRLIKGVSTAKLRKRPAPEKWSVSEIVAHLADHYDFYGEVAGVRIARKHLGWYTEALEGGAQLRREANAATTVSEQLGAVERFFDHLEAHGERLQYASDEDMTERRTEDRATHFPKSQQTRSNANRAREALAA